MSDDDTSVDEQGRAPGWEAAERAADTHAVKITGTGLPGSTGVEIDGHSIVNGLHGLTLAISGDQLPAVTLRLVPAILLDLALDARIVLDDDTIAGLKRLGWLESCKTSTPPRYADCDEAVDVRGKRWRYSRPGDVWKLVLGDSSVAAYSARSWQQLCAEFGPLTDAGSR